MGGSSSSSSSSSVEGLRKSQGVPDLYVSIARAKEDWDEGADTLLAVWTALKVAARCGRQGRFASSTNAIVSKGALAGLRAGETGCGRTETG